ncbi:hypothetical protein NPIL_695841, partial [Nephila pilipes]
MGRLSQQDIDRDSRTVSLCSKLSGQNCFLYIMVEDTIRNHDVKMLKSE